MTETRSVIPLYYSVPLLFICVAILSLMIFVYNLGDTVYLQTPIVPVNVNACGTLSGNDTYYVLTGSISFPGTGCFVIDGYNSTLDGDSQYMLSSDNTVGMSAVTVLGNGNTIRELNITGVHTGILINSANNTVITLNEIINSGNISIHSISSTNNNISLNTLSFVRSGVYLQLSSLSNILQNKIYGPLSFAFSTGVEIVGGNGNNVSDNFINSSLLGLSSSFTTNNFFYNNNLVGAFGGSIYLSYAADNKFINNYVVDSLTRGIYSSNSYNNYVKNLNVSGSGALFYDLETAGLSNSLDLVDTSFKKYILNNSLLKFYNSSNSRINFTQNITETGTDLSSDIKLRFNYVDVNSLTKPGLNKSAVISFEGIPNNLLNATAYRNGVICPLSLCYGISGLNAGHIMFNVLGWTNYSIGNGQTAFPTLDISEPDPDEAYTLGSFPLNFIIDLTQNGTAWFSLNNGSTNITMNTTDNLRFIYNQSTLSIGNYTFMAYATFTGTNFKDNRTVDFRVVPTIVGSSTPIIPSVPNTTSPLPPPSSNGSTIVLSNISSGSNSASGSVEFKYIAYWLVISILAILIVILIFLIIKALQARSVKQNTIPGSIVSQLR
ncbi:MAG: right-handed parallel beta-helix repeat-containing protein [Candidatus Pacearchaeota archaeon]